MGEVPSPPKRQGLHSRDVTVPPGGGEIAVSVVHETLIIVLGALLAAMAGAIATWFVQSRRQQFERSQIIRDEMTRAAADFVDAARAALGQVTSILSTYLSLSRDIDARDSKLDEVHAAAQALLRPMTRVELAFGASNVSGLAEAIVGHTHTCSELLEHLFSSVENKAPIEHTTGQLEFVASGLKNGDAGIRRFVAAARAQRESLKIEQACDIDLGGPYVGSIGLCTARDHRLLQRRADASPSTSPPTGSVEGIARDPDSSPR